MKNFKAGIYVNQGYYKSFQPNLINKDWNIEDMELLQLLGEANRLLGKLDMYSEYIPNIDLFINMHVLKEATQSNKIEGTQTNIDEAVLERDDISSEQQNDWDEIQNYTRAMNMAVERMKLLPFSARLIKEIHEILLQGVRGKHKLPGEFRRSQNWIGGSNIDSATFIPASHLTIPELISDIEHFAHNTTYFPEILKIAFIHYQFETVHPFLDGNGRIGRLLITLYLVKSGILKQPVLYLSDFLERNRNQYYDNLTIVREQNDINKWFKFFLRGVIETAKKSISTFDKILKLQKQIDEKIKTFGSRMGNAQKIITSLFIKPTIDASKITKLCEISSASAYKIISDMEKIDILKEITGAKRGKIYVFEDYLKLFR